MVPQTGNPCSFVLLTLDMGDTSRIHNCYLVGWSLAYTDVNVIGTFLYDTTKHLTWNSAPDCPSHHEVRQLLGLRTQCKRERIRSVREGFYEPRPLLRVSRDAFFGYTTWFYEADSSYLQDDDLVVQRPPALACPEVTAATAKHMLQSKHAICSLLCALLNLPGLLWQGSQVQNKCNNKPFSDKAIPIPHLRDSINGICYYSTQNLRRSALVWQWRSMFRRGNRWCIAMARRYKSC